MTVYQSELYRDKIPEQTLRLQAAGLGRVVFVQAVPGDSADRHHNAASPDRRGRAGADNWSLGTSGASVGTVLAALKSPSIWIFYGSAVIAAIVVAAAS